MATRQEMDAAMQELRDEVARDTDVNNSAKTVIAKLLDDIEAGVNDGDLQAVREVIKSYRANNDDLAAAVAESTPGEPTEPV
jgi:flagellar biosynthesis/type III secretory pathway protein FliH